MAANGRAPRPSACYSLHHATSLGNLFFFRLAESRLEEDHGQKVFTSSKSLLPAHPIAYEGPNGKERQFGAHPLPFSLLTSSVIHRLPALHLLCFQSTGSLHALLLFIWRLCTALWGRRGNGRGCLPTHSPFALTCHLPHAHLPSSCTQV